MSDCHPMKHERFDCPARVNTDPKGFARTIDSFQTHSFGLYIARGADHPKFGYLEIWLLRSLGLRLTKFHFRPEHDTGQDVYIDIASNTEILPDIWTTEDRYVDIVTFPDRKPDVLDLDELGDALAAGFIDHHQTAETLATTAEVLQGIEVHGTVEAWLATRGCDITWLDHQPTLTEYPENS